MKYKYLFGFIGMYVLYKEYIYHKQKKKELLSIRGHAKKLFLDSVNNPFPFNDFLAYFSNTDPTELTYMLKYHFNGTDPKYVSNDIIGDVIRYCICQNNFYDLAYEDRIRIINYVDNLLVIIRKKIPLINNSGISNNFPNHDSDLFLLYDTWTLYMIKKFGYYLFEKYISKRYNIHREFWHEVPIFFRYQNPDQKTILILSGLAGGFYTLHTFLPYLENHYNIVYPLHPLLYETSFTMMDLYEYTKLICQFIEQKKLKNIHVIAWSFGAVIAGIINKQFKHITINKQIYVEPGGFMPGSILAYTSFFTPLFSKFRFYMQVTGNKYIIPSLLFMFLTHYYKSYQLALLYPPYRHVIWDCEVLNNKNTTFLLSDNDIVFPINYSNSFITKMDKANVIIHKGYHGSWTFNKQLIPIVKKIIEEN